jgi:hypothetical protein
VPSFHLFVSRNSVIGWLAAAREFTDKIIWKMDFGNASGQNEGMRKRLFTVYSRCTSRHDV